MCLVAQDGIAYIVEVRYLNLVKQQGILSLTGVSYYSLFTDDYIAS